MTSHHRPRPGAAQSRTGLEPTPPEAEIRPVYQPVEIHYEDGSWAVGRINGWWQSPDGETWCRVRIPRSGTPARWVRFDPARLHLLQTEGT